MSIEAVSHDFFSVAKQDPTQTEEKISKWLLAAKIFIGIAVLFNPWTLGLILPLSAQAVSISIAAASLSVAGFVFSLIFYTSSSAQSKSENVSSVDALNHCDLTPAEHPVGLRNSSGANCWANAFFQFIMNCPRYVESLKKCPLKFKGVSLKTLINQYREDQNNLLKVSKVETQNLREIIHMKTSSISSDSTKQQDATVAFEAFSDWLPHFDSRERLNYSYKNLPPPYPAKNNINRTFEFLDNDRFSTVANHKVLVFPVIGGAFSSKKVQLTKLLDYCLSPQLMNDYKAKFFNNFSEKISYPFVSHERKLISPPEDLCLYLDRTENLEKEIVVPLKLSLEKSKHILNGNAEYVLDSFILHTGNRENGHYKTYVQKKGHWFECNDSSITEISEAKALDIGKKALMVHYSKVS
jgi:ubiquitin C-terminal hydrolase